MNSRYFRQAQNARPLAEINMVPLIDVMLVLLVIFMIAAPLLTHSVPVNLPVAGTPARSNDQPLTVSIKADGSLFLADQPLPRAGLQQRLQAQAQQNNQRELYIRADSNVPYHFVAETLNDSADAGLTHIGFVGRKNSH